MKKVIKEVEVLDYASEGKTFSKVDGKSLFIKKTAPGDIVDVLISKKRKDFLEGRVIKFHSYSDKRISPKCEHYDYCGGCQWQHVPYSEQIKFKEDQVLQQLNRIGKLDLKEIRTLIPCEDDFLYRNKMEYSFSNQKWLSSEEIKDKSIKKTDGLGFHISGRFDKVLNVENCHLQDDFGNKIRNWIRQYAIENEFSFYDLRKRVGELRSITLRNNRKGEWMLIFQFGIDLNPKLEEMLNAISIKFPELISIFYVINKKMNDTFLDLETELFKGAPYLDEFIHDLNFRIRPKSFFQTNPKQAEKLYASVLEFCGDLSNKTVYDLYTGTGTIALYLAQKAKKVIGVESVDQAIEDANWNAQSNSISNAEFHCGDMRDLLTEKFCKSNGLPDIIVCDPPRDGMHKNVLEVLLKLEAKRIIYVSCKPSTQARDLEILSEKYSVDIVQPVDMFPQTHHVENIVQLNLK